MAFAYNPSLYQYGQTYTPPPKLSSYYGEDPTYSAPAEDPNEMTTLPAGYTSTPGGGNLSTLKGIVGAGKDVYGVGKHIPGAVGKGISGLGSGLASKVAGMTGGKIQLGNIGQAGPWALGGLAASYLGGKIGKHNYRTGGFISGAGKGAATGASIGSVVPGIGTAVGGIVGGLIGGIKGLFGGAKRKRLIHEQDLAKQRAEDDQMFQNLSATYGGGRVNEGQGAASAEAQAELNRQSPEDQAKILKSFGNRDALEDWFTNVKANWAKNDAAKAAAAAAPTAPATPARDVSNPNRHMPEEYEGYRRYMAR